MANKSQFAGNQENNSNFGKSFEKKYGRATTSPISGPMSPGTEILHEVKEDDEEYYQE